jgi:dihydrofolate reductase
MMNGTRPGAIDPRGHHMRTVIVSEFVSLDGVMEAPGGDEGYRHAGWTFDIETDPTMYDAKFDEANEVEGLVLGRRTYDGFAAAWPGRDGDFADRFNGMPKYVVSSTLVDPTWNNTTVLPDVDAVAALRDRDGGSLCVQGSAQLVHELHRRGLVDEWRLMVWPVILGSGKRIFPDDADDKAKLRLEGSTTYANGVQLQIFRPER